MKTISVAVDCLFFIFVLSVCVCVFLIFRFFFVSIFHFVFPRSLVCLLFVCPSARFVGLLILCACKHFNEFFMSLAHWLSPASHATLPSLPRPFSSHMSLRTSQVVVKLIKYSWWKYHRADRGSSRSFVYTKTSDTFYLRFAIVFCQSSNEMYNQYARSANTLQWVSIWIEFLSTLWHQLQLNTSLIRQLGLHIVCSFFHCILHSARQETCILPPLTPLSANNSYRN